MDSLKKIFSAFYYYFSFSFYGYGYFGCRKSNLSFEPVFAF